METTTAVRPQEEMHAGPAALAVICTGYFMVILDGTKLLPTCIIEGEGVDHDGRQGRQMVSGQW
jgi:hypothetical protein